MSKSDLARFCILAPEIKHRGDNGDWFTINSRIKVVMPGQPYPTNGRDSMPEWEGEKFAKKVYGLTINGLVMSFHVNKLGRVDSVYFDFRDCYSIDLTYSRAIVKTLEKIKAAMPDDRRHGVREAWDALCKVFGPMTMATADGNYSMYSDSIWSYHGLASFERALDDLIEKETGSKAAA